MQHTVFLGGGFKHFFIFIPYLGKWSNLTHIFQMGWNHQVQGLSGEKKGGWSRWSTPHTQNQTQPMKPEDSWNFSWPWGKGEEFGNAPQFFFGFQRDNEHVNFKDEVQSCWSPNPTVKVKFHHEFCVDVEIVLRWNLACSLAKARLFSLIKPLFSPGAWRAVKFFHQFSALKKTL